ncbi:MAG: hypothetical protein DCF28_09665 [Alphaproteobacteria bacterium]|nr:MAG: hypothetical protein DCF28_09665 [Alphaproteobacteria bacterium]PZO34917.1 MAG: hypothetical protein DCE92_11285 [Alphaproteobacteria bacterium]
MGLFNRQNVFRGVLAALAISSLAAGVSAGAFIARGNPDGHAATLSRAENSNLRVYDAVWNLIDERHYAAGEPSFETETLRAEFRSAAEKASSPAELYHVVFAEMLSRLDESHIQATPAEGVFMPPGSFRPPPPRRGESPWPFPPEQAGHGMEVFWDGEKAVVDTVLLGSPAEQAGIEPGSSVAITDFLGAHPDEPGSMNVGTFAITVPGQETKTVRLEWPWTQVAYAERAAYCTPGGVMVIRFDEFSRRNVSWALAQIEDAGSGGIILDLRRNGGGRMNQFKRLVDVLLLPQSLIGTEVSSDRRRERIASPRSQSYTGKIAVLIGHSTASAAEMTARAIQFHQRGEVIGERSAGAVLVSQYFRLPDGGRLQVPVHEFLDPEGIRLEGRGVIPDLPVSSTLDDIRKGKDRAVEVAEGVVGAGQCDIAA